jgi:hypothetical protein
MKKNAMLKIAAILMVAVLLTTCAISSTFAKYTTHATSVDSARVAKFGVVVNTNITNLFEDNYTNVASQGDLDASGATITMTNLVAPGTSKLLELASTVTGKPEVAVSITYSTVIQITGWEIPAGLKDPAGNPIEEGLYFPVIFTVGTETYGLEGMHGEGETDPADNTYSTTAALITAVQDALATYGSDTIAAGTDLTGNGVSDVTFGWEWAFDDNDDAKDTALGNLLPASQPSITVSITTTVSQVD